MTIPLYQVDAFTDQVFSGNPAAVCPLDNWLPDQKLQAIAAENNLAETAFFVPEDGGYRLRWFTPLVEVDLCGHATLASAYILYEVLDETAAKLVFHTKSGQLTVARSGKRLVLDFPSRPPEPVEPCTGLAQALGGNPEQILAARDYLVVYRSEAEVRALTPDLAALLHINRFAVIVTAPGDHVDFVSRFFAPAKGVPEDP